MADDAGAQALRDLLADAMGRVREEVAELAESLTQEVGTYRPGPRANSIEWLLWHLARVQDDHVSELAGTEQVWTADGWCDRFALPFEPGATGFGQDAKDVAAFTAEPELLDQYQAAVHKRCLAYIESLTPGELARVVDDSWNPPVTAGARLVSVLGDCMQHLGQAAYVRGLAERR